MSGTLKFALLVLTLTIHQEQSTALNLWGVMVAPFSWFKDTVVDTPLNMGSRFRYYMDDETQEEEANMVQPDIQQLPDVDTNSLQSFIDQDRLVQNSAESENGGFLSSIFAPQIIFETEANDTSGGGQEAPVLTGSEVDLDSILQPNTLTGEAAGAFERYLSPILGSALSRSDQKPSYDTTFLEQFGTMRDGEHAYDGENLILNLPQLRTTIVEGNETPRPDENAQMVFVDLSELRPLLNKRILTVFTGLGNGTVGRPYFPYNQETIANKGPVGQGPRLTERVDREKQAEPTDQSTSWYKTVSRLGESVRSVNICRSTFRPCTYSSKQLGALGKSVLLDVLVE